eukprot:SAG22_NODE_43_length_25304_cov_5.394644_13_plen_100_part_00
MGFWVSRVVAIPLYGSKCTTWISKTQASRRNIQKTTGSDHFRGLVLYRPNHSPEQPQITAPNSPEYCSYNKRTRRNAALIAINCHTKIPYLNLVVLLYR